jgi:hypothetical protein
MGQSCVGAPYEYFSRLPAVKTCLERPSGQHFSYGQKKNCLEGGRQSLAIWHMFDSCHTLDCHTSLFIWLTYHKVNFLPTFATICGFQNRSHTFVAVTLAKVWLGKVWLGTKQAVQKDEVVWEWCFGPFGR